MQSDAELVGAVLAGQPEAYATLVRRYGRAVRAVATAVLRDTHAAQDAAQEAFVIAHRQLHRLRNGAVFGGWVLKVARREAIRMGRRQSRRRQVELPPDVPAPDRDGRLEGVPARLLDAVMRLPEHERLVVMLRYLDGQSVQAIGEMTGQPIGTITVQLSRARSRLRGWLEDREP